MKSKRKPTGGRLKTSRRCDKKLSWKGGTFTATKLNPQKDEISRESGIGNTFKLKLKGAKFANVLDTKTQKTQKLEIANVLENLANREYARRNIITKGAVINTEAGKAKVTSRPGQDGTINAILIE